MNMCPPPREPLTLWQAYLQGWNTALHPDYLEWAESPNFHFMGFHAALAIVLLAIVAIAAHYLCRECWIRIPLRFRVAIAGIPFGSAGLLLWFVWVKTADITFRAEHDFAVTLLTIWRTLGILLPASFAIGGSLILAAALRTEWDAIIANRKTT